MISANVVVSTLSRPRPKIQKLQKQRRQTQQSNTKDAQHPPPQVQQTRRKVLLMIMTILGHDLSKCCCVDTVTATAKNTKTAETKATNPTIKHKRCSTSIPQHLKTNRNVLLMIMAILGHDLSKCCCVDAVAAAAKNTKTAETKATNPTIKYKKYTTSSPASIANPHEGFADDHDHSWS